jgi:U3 small nucleolar RNA-associated protein 25
MRPRVLVLLPFRNNALEFIKTLIKLTPKIHKDIIAKKKKFNKEFGSETTENTLKNKKGEDFNNLFKGNIDDCFTIGISFTKKTIQLYSDIYNSDIIIASPLGLRLLISNNNKSSELEYDLLSSIEVLIVDQLDVILMQNWEHLLIIFDNLNKLPKSTNNTDFSRVMNWYLNSNAKFNRQTILLSSFLTPEINSIWNRKCQNVSGKFKTLNIYDDGFVSQILSNIRQIFYRIQVNEIEDESQQRYNYFINELIPKFINSEEKHTLIFIPSYFDFIRIRNYFKNQKIEFCQCSEYTKSNKVSQSRSYFEQGTVSFMLFTERFHFYNRYKIKGIHNIIFYGLPICSQFYSDILNLIEKTDAECSVLFTKFDKFALERIVGTNRSERMINSQKSTYLIC